MKTIKELEDEMDKRYKGVLNPEVSHTFHELLAEIRTLKHVLELIDEIHTDNKVGLAIIKEIRKRIIG